MSTKIKSVTVINLQGTHCYSAGNEYNGLLLDHIEDQSVEFPESLTIIYRGFTADHKYVFEVINAPVDVEFERL